MKRFLAVLIACGATAALHAQSDKVTVAFSDPSRPGTVKASLVNGGITVTGYAGKEVIVEATGQGSEGRRRGRREREEAPAGMKRIAIASSGLTVEEENNVMVIGASHAANVDLKIQVPQRTSLSLKTVNDGELKVENVQGEFEINNINGNVTLTNVSGSTVAHALNGKVTATFVQVDPQKPMSFSSLNGNIDVTFPADLKANVKIKSDRGEVFSDFEIAMQATPRTVVEDGRSKGGKYRVQIDKTFTGAINGGGREIQFTNFNGNIYIRKK
jgi:DUF4097 and DUF4098 domain-containing protein YvlB